MSQRSFNRNFGWLLLEKVIALPTVWLFTVILARSVSEHAFGEFHFLLALVALLSPFIHAGLHSLVTKELHEQPDQRPRILSTAIAVRCSAWLVFMSVFFLISGWSEYLTHDQFFLMLVLAFGQLWSSLQVLVYWYEYQGYFRPLVLIRIAHALMFLLIKLLVLYFYPSVAALIYCCCLEIICLNILIMLTYKRSDGDTRLSVPSVSYAYTLISKSKWLFFSGIAALIYLRIDQVMLGLLRSQEELAHYAVAVSLSEAWYFIPTIAVSILFSRIMDVQKENPTAYQRFLQSLMGNLFWSAVIVALLMTACSEALISLLFGRQYADAYQIFNIHVWAGVFIAVRALLSKWLIAEDLLAFSLVTQVSGAVSNIVLNALLIPYYGAKGAAVATVVSYACATWLALFLHPKTLRMGIAMSKAPVVVLGDWIQKLRQ